MDVELNQLAPLIPRVEPPSLAEYFNAETFFLKLANKEGRLEAISRSFSNPFRYAKSVDV